MCGRFVQLPLFDKSQASWPELADDLAGITAKYNLAPTQRAAVVLGDGDKLELRKLRWGLIPPWAKDLKGGFTTINARVETVAIKPAYRAAWKAPRRCLVPMAGYYEWRDEDGGKLTCVKGVFSGLAWKYFHWKCTALIGRPNRFSQLICRAVSAAGVQRNGPGDPGAIQIVFARHVKAYALNAKAYAVDTKAYALADNSSPFEFLLRIHPHLE